MTLRPHHLTRLRRRRPDFDLALGDETVGVWLPHPDDSLVVATIADAVSVALACLELPVEREVLALLDEERRIVSMLLDPPAGMTCSIGWLDGPGLEVPFSHTLLVRPVPVVETTAPPPEVVAEFHHLRAMHVLQGVGLLDVLRVDRDRVQSLAVCLDPDCVWFDEPQQPPLPAA